MILFNDQKQLAKLLASNISWLQTMKGSSGEYPNLGCLNPKFLQPYDSDLLYRPRIHNLWLLIRSVAWEIPLELLPLVSKDSDSIFIWLAMDQPLDTFNVLAAERCGSQWSPIFRPTGAVSDLVASSQGGVDVKSTWKSHWESSENRYGDGFPIYIYIYIQHLHIYIIYITNIYILQTYIYYIYYIYFIYLI